MDFRAWLEAHDFDPKTLSRREVDALRTAYRVGREAAGLAGAEPADAGGGAAAPAGQADPRLAAEQERLAAIEEICFPTGRAPRHPEIGARAIEEGWTPLATARAVKGAEDERENPDATAAGPETRASGETPDEASPARPGDPGREYPGPDGRPDGQDD